ncbi:MAG: holo-ACP synthase [Clostridia bacterium]|nr:holo-ACP synthase [Clostridia bacterium]
MIAGLGTDIVEISRIAHSMEKKRFLQDYFGQEEHAMLQERGFPVESVAANFAAKEAFAKSLGTGVRGFLLREVQVLRGDLGEVILQLEGNAAALAQAHGLTRFHVSVSHCGEYAVATVIAES